MFFQSIARVFKKLSELLTEPFASLKKAEDRRRAKITTTILLALLILIGTDQVLQGDTPFLIFLFIVVGYFLARTHWYKFATLFLLITLSLPSYRVALTTPTPDSSHILNASAWLAIPLILSGVIYSVRTTIIFSVINMVFMASLPVLRTIVVKSDEPTVIKVR